MSSLLTLIAATAVLTAVAAAAPDCPQPDEIRNFLRTSASQSLFGFYLVTRWLAQGIHRAKDHR